MRLNQLRDLTRFDGTCPMEVFLEQMEISVVDVGGGVHQSTVPSHD